MSYFGISLAARNFLASSAPIQPLPAAVIAWRYISISHIANSKDTRYIGFGGTRNNFYISGFIHRPIDL
jgi:hypothetical protein